MIEGIGRCGHLRFCLGLRGCQCDHTKALDVTISILVHCTHSRREGRGILQSSTSNIGSLFCNSVSPWIALLRVGCGCLLSQFIPMKSSQGGWQEHRFSEYFSRYGRHKDCLMYWTSHNPGKGLPWWWCDMTLEPGKDSGERMKLLSGSQNLRRNSSYMA